LTRENTFEYVNKIFENETDNRKQLNSMSSIKLFESKKYVRFGMMTKKMVFLRQDVVEILTDSADIKQYIKKLKSRDPQLFANWGTICTLVEMTAAER